MGCMQLQVIMMLFTLCMLHCEPSMGREQVDVQTGHLSTSAFPPMSSSSSGW